MRPLSRIFSLALPLALRLAVLLAAAAPIAPLSAQRPFREQLDSAALRPRSDSFAVMVQGVARGWQRLGIARDGGGWRLTDAIAIGTMVQQQSIATFDAGLQETSLRQSGVMRQTPMEISLDWREGRVRGSALTPSSGTSPLAIDAAIPEGTIDDNAVTPLLAGVRWREGLDATFPVLLSGEGTVVSYRLRVVGADTTTVPAGHFETWRAELGGGEGRLVLHVTRGAPHRVVRMQPVGAPFDIQLVR